MDENNRQDPTPAIIDTIKGAATFLAELSDKTISLATEGTVFEKLPIVWLAVNGLKVRDSFQKYRLKRNCRSFLEALGTCKPEDLERFRSELEVLGSSAEEFADTTFSILIESEKPIKAEFFGRLLRARISGRLNHKQFEDLALIVQAGSIPALLAVSDFYRKSGGTSYSQAAQIKEEPMLLSLGISSRHGSMFRLSDLGKLLTKVICKPSE